MTYFDIHTHSIRRDAIYNAYKAPKEGVMFSIGIHPWFISNMKDQLDELNHVLIDKAPVAVGECGLDKLCDTVWEVQLDAFRAQIRLAEKYHKPLIIHCVRAFQECLRELKDFRGNVLFHGFNKNQQLLNQLMGFENVFVSFGESVFDSRNEAIVRNCDLSKIFLETDDAAVGIDKVYVRVSEIRGLSITQLKDQIELNRKVFFS